MPNLPELILLRIPQRVGPHYRDFGNLLLNDKTGAIVECLVHQMHGDVEQIVMGILLRWLKTPEDTTWNYLIRVLRDIQLNALAAEIEANITGIYCYSKI